MSTPKPTTKDQLVYYLLSNISLGTYDKKFLSNIQTNYITKQKPVTTNQSDLLNKIIVSYSRQLGKKEILSTDMVDLPWNINPIESSAKFTNVHLFIEDDVIVLTSPYKTEFVKELRSYPYSEWHKEDKFWSLPASEVTLKFIVSLTKKHFTQINYCEKITEFLNTVAEYEDCKYWEPTLEICNENYYIVATNSALDDALGDMTLSNSPPLISKLVSHGVAISDNIKYNMLSSGITNKQIQFITSWSPSLEYDVDSIMDSIGLIQADYVLLCEAFESKKDFMKELTKRLSTEKIDFQILEKRKTDTKIDMSSYKLPVVITGWSFVSSSLLASGAAKSITLVNSNPIEIK